MGMESQPQKPSVEHLRAIFTDNGVNEKPPRNFLEKMARLAKIPDSERVIPDEGTLSYTRLQHACEHYVNTIDRQTEIVDPVKLGGLRREYHNALCLMLFGTPHIRTSYENRDKAYRFAALVMGRRDLLKKGY